MNKERIILCSVIILLLLCLLFSINRCSKKSVEVDNITNILEATNDTLITYRNEKGQLVSKIQVIEMQSEKDFASLNFKDEEIVKLQSLVKSYEKKIKDGTGTYIVIEGETKYDTSYIEVIVDPLSLQINVENEWIKCMASREDSIVDFSLSVRNEYELVLGEDKKLKKLYAEVTNLNPYSSTSMMRVYQSNTIKKKRFGLGVSLGGAIIPFKPYVTPYIGIGINYNIIQF